MPCSGIGHTHIISPQATNNRQSQRGAIEIDPEMQSQKIELKPLLQPDAHAQ